jgi:hypothetical protein
MVSIIIFSQIFKSFLQISGNKSLFWAAGMKGEKIRVYLKLLMLCAKVSSIIERMVDFWTDFRYIWNGWINGGC